jgi:pSer/pThr/pTyr-binding forkhead associated (FHA) protein
MATSQVAARPTVSDSFSGTVRRPPSSVTTSSRGRRLAGRPARRLPRELVVTDEGGRRTVPLKDSLTVGRAATCDVAIRDTYVSNVHARIYQRDGSWWLEDLGSTNGTYINRTRVQQPTVIGPGDEVKIGKATLELRR